MLTHHRTSAARRAGTSCAAPAPPLRLPFPDLTLDRVRQIVATAYAFQNDPVVWADELHAVLGPSLDLGQGTLVGSIGA